MRVLVVGHGGREHALCWFLARTATVFCAPGNPGTARVGTNLPIRADEPQKLIEAVRQHRIDLTIVGPEGPLAAGLVDDLAGAGYAAFGPTARAARIEASKAWAKTLMQRAGVPTAASQSFTDRDQAVRYIAAHAEPLVVKASGLAAGKGAVVCRTRQEAGAATDEMFGGRFGAAGREVVIEEFLHGEEASVLALTDGSRVSILPVAQDHKRLLEGDEGPNTGGMGAYAPVSLIDDALLAEIEKTVLQPTVNQLAADGSPYRGVLYAGLMISPERRPSVVEFNCRFGDPETEAILPIVSRELAADFWAIARGEAWHPPPRIPSHGAAVTTVLASRGYPEKPEVGLPIRIPAILPRDTILFHAGTTMDHGTLRTSGGRVLCATGVGRDVAAAQVASRSLADAVAFEGKTWRRDIGSREMARARAS